jgi:hypothetical protein
MSVEPVGIQVEVGLEALHADLQQGVISLSAPDGWIVKPPSVEVTGLRAGHRHAVAFDVTVPPGCRDDVYQLGCQVSVGDGEYGVALQPIRQQAAGVKAADDGSSFVTETFLVAPASVAVHVIDASFVRTLRYGYISGADEGVVDTLSRFGVRIDEVSEHQLAYSDLSEFDAVVIGPNAYVVRDDVRQSAGRLLDYVEKGGTLIVQYQSYPFEVGGFAPYPFRFRHPHDRVTLPDSPVYILDADHPVIVGANKIGAADFDDWVHDRGLYFWGEWDRRYVPVLSSHDPGEDAKGGGLLAAEYGRGTYVYAAYSFFRQVPAGVPGAIRLFANLLGLAEAKVRHRIELVKSLSLFSWMTEAEIYDVARVMSQQIWDAGSYLCRQGDHSTDLFIVVAGHVEVVKEDAEGERVLYIAAAGEAIGELAMLAETARSASLRSQDDVTALVMRSRDFEALINQRPEMAGAFVRMLARRLAAAAES